MSDKASKTGPGKPKSTKKGKKSWAPAQKLQVLNKSKDFRYRWRDNDQANLERAKAEGWVFVNKETGIPGEHDHPQGTEDGIPLSDAKTYRELALMALPEEDGKARDEYFSKLTDKQTVGLKDQLDRNLDNEAGKARSERAKSYGSIIID